LRSEGAAPWGGGPSLVPSLDVLHRRDTGRAPGPFACIAAAAFALACGCSRGPDPVARSEGTSEPASTREQDAQDAGTVAALVNGRAITARDLDARLAADAELREEIAGAPPEIVWAGRHALLQRMIDELVLEEEARRRGTSREALEAELTAGVVLTDEEAERSYQRARLYPGGNVVLDRRTQRLLAGSESEARERIRAFVLREKKRLAVRRFVLPLRERATIEIKLAKPPAAARG
jgi:hypothetical protein